MSSAKNPAIKKWIDRTMTSNPPRAKSVVMTLFGDVITPHGGQAWLGSLIELLAPFGINDRLVRTSVFRLAEEGWLDAQREGRRSQYALNPAAARRFERAYQRIYTPSHHEWKGEWTLLFATSNAITMQQRADLRKELLWEGFGLIAPLVFGHPSADPETLDDILVRVGVKDHAVVCKATDTDLIAARPMRDLISQAWELGTVIANYERFIQDFSALQKLLNARESVNQEQAFVIRTLLIHEFRRVQLHDPQLPLDLLPENWPGKIAYELCREIYRATCKDVEQYVLEILRREDESTPDAAPYFYKRFGGLI
jgi:phenylacetic acid degradation operon negative regulatory protein